MPSAPEPQALALVQPRLRWWREFMIAAVFYGVYSLVRNQFGSATLAPGEQPIEAFDNALRVIHWEQLVGIYREEAVQQAFLGWEWFIRFWNVYYGTFHFVVTIVAFVWLFLRAPERFPRWRNTLGFTTGLAIVGFALFPLMPPRLLNAPPPYGGMMLATHDYGFVDTLATVGGLWSFDSGAMQELSNQYAAMPSLHTGWSLWCVLVLWPLVRRPTARVVLALYVPATVFCIVVTGNHFVLDAVGGVIVLAVGYLLGRWLDQWWSARHRERPALAEPSPIADAAVPLRCQSPGQGG